MGPWHVHHCRLQTEATNERSLYSDVSKGNRCHAELPNCSIRTRVLYQPDTRFTFVSARVSFHSNCFWLACGLVRICLEWFGW